MDGESCVLLDAPDAVWRNPGGEAVRIDGADDPIVAVASEWFVDHDLIVARASGTIERYSHLSGERLWAFDAGAPVGGLVSPWGDNRVLAWTGGRFRTVDTAFGTGFWE